jgi:hypothetical protein
MGKSPKRQTSSKPITRVSANSESRPVARTSIRSGLTTEFNPDYTYIVKDLKRIGTLAASFFVIIIVLSFILK